MVYAIQQELASAIALRELVSIILQPPQIRYVKISLLVVSLMAKDVFLNPMHAILTKVL